MNVASAFECGRLYPHFDPSHVVAEIARPISLALLSSAPRLVI